MVAIPIGYDQPGVAARIAYHGVGEFVEVGASLVTSSGTLQTLPEYLPSSSTSCSGLRAVATTRSPASSTASVNARPRPREAPVMSHTFDISPLSAVPESGSPRDCEPCDPFLMHRSVWSLQTSSTTGATQLLPSGPQGFAYLKMSCQPPRSDLASKPPERLPQKSIE